MRIGGPGRPVGYQGGGLYRSIFGDFVRDFDDFESGTLRFSGITAVPTGFMG
jgi:hypothetical protein